MDNMTIEKLFGFGGPFFVLLWVFGWAGFALLAWRFKNKHEQQRLERIHRERMAAIEKGLPLPELPEYERNGLSQRRPNPRWSLGLAAILVMTGIGLQAAYSGPETRDLSSVGLLVLFVGFGFGLHHFLTAKPRPDENEDA